MKAIHEIGWIRVFRYLWFTFVYEIYRLIPVSPLRIWYLRLCGAKIGRDCVFHRVEFFNYDRSGFSGLSIGNEVFIGEYTLLDLAERITIESQVTLAERVTVLTHLNVGFQDHPLQKEFPSETGPVWIKSGSFIGANTMLLHGCIVGPRTFVGAQSLVKEGAPADALVAGVPAKIIRPLKKNKSEVKQTQQDKTREPCKTVPAEISR